MKLWILAAALAFPALGQDACVTALVEPYSSGRHLVYELRARGIEPVIVLTSDTPPKGYSLDPTWNDVILMGTPEQAADELLRRGNQVVIYDGAESGTVDAARLRDVVRARGVQTPGSSGALAWARRDKLEMALVLGKFAPRRIGVTSHSQARRAAREIGYPVVVKPNRNAGGTNVSFCRNDAELARAIAKIKLGRRNEMNEVDTAAVVEEALWGTEHAFNGIRDANGKVVFTGVWEYQRRRTPYAASTYEVDRLVNPHKPWVKRHLADIVKAAKKLDIVGPFHMEQIGGKIVDAGPRLSGGGLPLLEKAATNINPFARTVDAYLDPQGLGRGAVYRRKAYAAGISISTEGGVRASHRMAPELEKLKQEGIIIDYSFAFEEDELLYRTVDSDTAIAQILVKTRTKEEREQLIARLLRARDEGEFENR